MIKKLGIIVPFRNRYEHLGIFKKHMIEYFKGLDVDYEIFIIEQDNIKEFNRGTLLNIGYVYAKKANCDYLVFHDVDMLPIDVDYSYSDVPIHLATNFIEGDKEIFDQYFGGVTMFPIKDFELINGFSNQYWGWGFEDNDLLIRCEKKNIQLDTKEILNSIARGRSVNFNGFNSYIECKNIIDFKMNGTFTVTFKPNRCVLNHSKESDEFTIFSIPGYDFAISYNSFSRYNFCAFDSDLNALYVNSKITTNYRTTISVIMDFNEKNFKVYQDGEFIGQTKNFKRLYNYRSENKFYLGVGNLQRDNEANFFDGELHRFLYHDTILDEKQIQGLANGELINDSLVINYNTNNIKDYKLINLVNNDLSGEIHNCNINHVNNVESVIRIPFRRKSTFKLLEHENNGFENNKWKYKTTRWNQLKYHNELNFNDFSISEDGINSLNFTVHNIETQDNITTINVGINEA